jgi:glutamate-1-semialdehyde 2,1-aminomutase
MATPLNEPPVKDRYLDPASETARLHAEASALIPGGTSRLHYVFKPYPVHAQQGAGCRLTDVDGDVRIDCLNNMTALIHGHCDPVVNAAIIDQVQRGVSFSEPSEPEFALAAAIVGRVPSVERVHFRSSGTEAVMMAIKLARAFTGRHRIAKFEGAYHGYYDYVQMGVGSHPGNWGDATAPRSIASSGGLSPSVTDEVLVLPFNDRDGVEQLLDAQGSELAALLVEPLSNKSGMARPDEDFYGLLRELCDRHGIILVFDEVIAFRLGVDGAQGRYGGAPDLTTFGKIIGGGLPIGAVGGRADILEALQPGGGSGSVLSGGTYSGNPLSAAAGLATLGKLHANDFERLDALGERMRAGVNSVFRAWRQCAQASGDGSLFQIVPTDRPIENYRSVPTDAASEAWLSQLHRGLLEAGVIISHRGLSCLSTAMDESVVDECLDAFERAVAGMQA